MAYYIVSDGAIKEAFETSEEATARAKDLAGSRVIGDEWVTLGTAKHKVEQARMALDEVAPLLNQQELEQMRATLRDLESVIVAALARTGLAQT